jgi:hypothetical protein
MINNFIQNINMSKTIHLLKNDSINDYNDLFIKNQNKDNLKEARILFESKKLNIRCKDKRNINNYFYNFENPKRIIIEHDIINSMNKNEKNNNYNSMSSDNLDKINDNKNIKNIKKNNLDNFNLNEILKENEELKKDNEEIKKELLNTVKKMEKSDKLRKKLEGELVKQKKEMEKVSNSVEEIKNQLINEKKELERQLNEEKIKNKEIEIINEDKKLKEKINEQITINKEIEMEIINNECINNNQTNQKNEIFKGNDNIKDDTKEEHNYLDNNNFENNIDFAITNSEKRNTVNERNNSINNETINELHKINEIKNNEEEEIKVDINNDNYNENFKTEIKENNNTINNEEKTSVKKNKEEDDFLDENKKESDNNGIKIENNNNENVKSEAKEDKSESKEEIKDNHNMINNSEKDDKLVERKENKKENEYIQKSKESHNEKEVDEINDKKLEKEEENSYVRKATEKLVEDVINIKEIEISPNNKYKAEYYEGNILSLIKKLKSENLLDKIDEKVKIAFNVENNIYNEESYLIGQYPQVIVCKSYENEEEITGICSFYNQNTTKDINIIMINFLCAISTDDDKELFEQLFTMINFIKNYVNYNEIYIILNYNKIVVNEKIQFKLNEEILSFFKYKMKFIWVCVENIKEKSRKQKLIYRKENKKVDEDDYYIDITNEHGFLSSETFTILSFMKKDNNINNNKYNFNNYKYMNNLPIYALITSQKKLLLVDFKNNKHRFDCSKLFFKENPIITILSPENRTLEELKLNINEEYDNIMDIIKDSLFLEKYKTNGIISSFGLFKMNLNIFFKNIINTKINNYYYNRISSNEIEIIKDKKNNLK